MPLNNPRFTRTAYFYIGLVIAAGLSAVTHSVYSLVETPAPSRWVFLAALTLFTGSFSVKVPGLAARLSVSESFVFAAVLLYGPAVATIIVTLDSLVMSMWSRRDQRFGMRWLFNVASAAVAMWIAATTFFWLAQIEPGHLTQLFPLENRLWQLFALAGLYFLFNSGLIAIVLAFDRSSNVFKLWWANFPWFSLNYFGGVSVAALFVSYTRSVDFSAIGIILPLLLISYLTYRTSLGRIEDATRHIDQVNALYMATIETLAMAVDAKDQITHGHIRRVQVFTVELARRLGVTDEQQLRGIATAALLHDMGKLAIPEHILNKPGKLTPGEFNKMKRHADIGADLLSSIKFPYPVVPIVRHHHEWWNGGGYPAGISGSDIPLGARILSVVDCFDALTSDRPYRPRLSTHEAFAILRERSGTLYDPLVVDAFIEAHPEIAPLAKKAGDDAKSIMGLAAPSEGGKESSPPLTYIHANSAESALLADLERRLRGTSSARQALESLSQLLRQLTPASVFALYEYSPDADTLTCVAVTGDPNQFLAKFTIVLGERVTGWCGANLRSSVNSHAALDLGHLAELFDPPLRSTLSIPIVAKGELAGVLTAYSSKVEAFENSHRYLFEHVVSLIADSILGVEPDHALVSFSRRKL